MRLFGVVGGTLNQARATYGFIPPFDLALSLPLGTDNFIDNGGFIFDLAGVFALQYNQIMIGYPDWVFIAPAQQFNPVNDNTIIIGGSADNETGIVGSAGGGNDDCVC